MNCISEDLPREIRATIAFLPLGMYCNASLADARPGDTLRFRSAWRSRRARIVQLWRCTIGSPEFSFLLRLAYGPAMTAARLLQRWEALAVVEGLGAEGFSRQECLVVQLEQTGA